MPLGLSNRNKIMLLSGCEGRARCRFHKKYVQSVRFVVKRRGCCCICNNVGCNLSVGIALNVWFTMNGMCAKNNTHIYVARTSNNRVIAACELYCCLLPQCEALRTCRSGYPIATPSTRSRRISCFSFQIDHGRHKDFFQTGAMVDFSRWKAFFQGFLRKGATTLKLYFSKSKQT